MELGKVVSTFTTKKGNTACIRYPVWSDLDGFLTFANKISKEDTFIQLSGEVLSRNEETDFLAGAIANMEKGKAIQLVATVNDNFAANCGIDIDIRRKKHVGSIHIAVDEDFREEGIGAELMKALISEAKIAKLRLLTLTCIEGNDRAIHVYESVGFTKVGTTPKAILYHEEYVGEILMYLQLV
jgi:RimJ/RimL family protein N-acetyltransferase